MQCLTANVLVTGLGETVKCLAARASLQRAYDVEAPILNVGICVIYNLITLKNKSKKNFRTK